MKKHMVPALIGLGLFFLPAWTPQPACTKVDCEESYEVLLEGVEADILTDEEAQNIYGNCGRFVERQEES